MEMEHKIDSEKAAKSSIHNQKKGLRSWVGSLLDFGNLQVPIIFAAILLHMELLLIIIIFTAAASKFLMNFKLTFKKTRNLDEA